MPQTPRSALAVVLAAACVAADTPPADVASLLQHYADVSSHTARMSGPSPECQCLNWKETYGSGKAQCGSGFEFTRALGYPKANRVTSETWLKMGANKSSIVGLQAVMGAEFC